jgi:pyridoxine 5-phosphate synthase
MVPRLGVNIDHVATLRQARRGMEPDPVAAAALSELGGADLITIHLREDRRHIQDRDLRILRETVQTRLNLEAAITGEILDRIREHRPDYVTFVPEKREELTTEGGLDVIKHRDSVKAAIDYCHNLDIPVSLFIDPEPNQVEMAALLGTDAVELHTGKYAEVRGSQAVLRELSALKLASSETVARGIHLHCGHGLNYANVGPIAAIPHMEELNIGHSIISRAVFIGLREAVSEMKSLIVEAHAARHLP